MGIRHVQKCRTSLVLIVSPCPTHRMLFDLQYNGVLGRCCTIFIQRGSLINMILVCMARFDTHDTKLFPSHLVSSIWNVILVRPAESTRYRVSF